ncbi:MAG: hypothetical protein V3T33_04590 [Myxococcota bacterium]
MTAVGQAHPRRTELAPNARAGQELDAPSGLYVPYQRTGNDQLIDFDAGLDPRAFPDHQGALGMDLATQLPVYLGRAAEAQQALESTVSRNHQGERR